MAYDRGPNIKSDQYGNAYQYAKLHQIEKGFTGYVELGNNLYKLWMSGECVTNERGKFTGEKTHLIRVTKVDKNKKPKSM